MEEKRTINPSVAVAMVLLLSLPLLYFLSMGPLFAIYMNGPTDESPEWLGAYCAPIRWLREQSSVFERLLVWYLSFWGLETE